MTIAPLDLILLLGALQGFILAFLLWFDRNGPRPSNRLLGALVGLFALASLAVGIPIANQYVSLFIDLTPLIMVFPMGPLIYFYTRSLLEPEFRIGKNERRHFYLVVLDWGAPLIGWVFIGGLLLGIFKHESGRAWGNVMDQYNTYADIPRWFSLTIYLVLAIRFLNRYRPATGSERRLPEQRQGTVRWLRQFLTILLTFQVLWLLFLVPYIVPETRNSLLDMFGWYPLYIPIAVMIYWFGLKGYLYARATAAGGGRKTATSLPVESIDKVVPLLKKAMEADKLYLDPELSVEKLGKHLGLTPKIVSFVLNQRLDKSFNTFVNEYRVEEVKRRLLEPGSRQLTLTGLAFDCGFNSQATFQRAFRQVTQLSPREYIARQTVS